MRDSDTIFALATPPGRSALALFRISGGLARDVLEALTGRPCMQPREAGLRTLYGPDDGEMIDQAVVTFFAGPASFTGEDMVELSVHGGRGVVSTLSRALVSMAGVRSAEPGEFTRRAFQSGKIDLSQAEAIADLIDSETEFQRRQALRVLDGALGRRVDGWRGILLAIAAELETALDFSDEGDVGALAPEGVLANCAALEQDLKSEIRAGARSVALRDGFTVVISGPPNAGKSTLFNRLAGKDLAIVTEFAGTTRDLVVAKLDLDGVPVTLVDSAGLHASVDPVEAIGMDRARKAARSADLVLWLSSCDTKSGLRENFGVESIAVWSKSDLQPGAAGVLQISENDSDSISFLATEIRARALAAVGDGSEGSVIRERHRSCLCEAVGALERLRLRLWQGQIELAAEECRVARDELGRISGAIGVEDVLGEIFQRFCIGK